MPRRFAGLAVVMAGLVLVTGPAMAQPGLSTKPDYDAIEKADRIDEFTQADSARLHNLAAEALSAKDFATAEARLQELLAKPQPARDSNFMMGLAKTGLGKWDEAKTYLERAVAAEPSRPEPKTRLGLALVMLGETDAARAQRDALAGLDAGCKQACADAAWIKDGIVALDVALKQGPKAAAKASVDVAATPGAPFDPAKYNLVAFNDTHDLYDLLTQPGRCPAKTTAAAREPCALILYRLADGTVDTSMASNFKPVFKVVNRQQIWAIHDKKLQQVKIEDLYFDNDDVIGKQRGKYVSVALIGNAENTANCAAEKPCLGNLVKEDMFHMYSGMPDSVVEVIWGAGMKDVGTVRVR